MEISLVLAKQVQHQYTHETKRSGPSKLQSRFHEYLEISQTTDWKAVNQTEQLLGERQTTWRWTISMELEATPIKSVFNYGHHHSFVVLLQNLLFVFSLLRLSTFVYFFHIFSTNILFEDTFLFTFVWASIWNIFFCHYSSCNWFGLNEKKKRAAFHCAQCVCVCSFLCFVS